MSFNIDDESVYLKYTEIWNKIKDILNVKFNSQPIYDDKYIKTKVKKFDNMINTLFSGDKICIEGRQEKLSSSLFRTSVNTKQEK